MNLKKSMLIGVLALACAIPMQANAGKFKKIIAIGALATAGVVAYKIAQKLNVGDETQNLIKYPDNAIPYLKKNPERIPFVVSDLNVIFNSPDYSPDGPNKPEEYLDLANKIEKDLGVPVDRGPWSAIKSDNSTKTMNAVAVTIVEDEELLAKNMEMSGYGSKPYGFKAFHLINSKNNALPILMNFGIDINSAINGVYLPNEIYDAFKHNEVYQNNSAEKIDKVYGSFPNKNAIENALRDLSKELAP